MCYLVIGKYFSTFPLFQVECVNSLLGEIDIHPFYRQRVIDISLWTDCRNSAHLLPKYISTNFIFFFFFLLFRCGCGTQKWNNALTAFVPLDPGDNRTNIHNVKIHILKNQSPSMITVLFYRIISIINTPCRLSENVWWHKLMHSLHYSLYSVCDRDRWQNIFTW